MAGPRAAIYWNAEAYDTSGPTLMGRHSAGESFVRGYLRYGTAERLTLWNVLNRPTAELEPLVERLGNTKPIDWIGRNNFGGLFAAGVVNLPVPGLGRYAWARRAFHARAFSLCGVTHTTATARVHLALNDLAIAPTQPWDALVCTSRAVVASIKVQAEMLDEYLKERLGAQTITRPQYAHIPLGVNTTDFEASPEHRKRWRDELSIPEDAIVVLYVGRFSFTAKMNPAPMALALEKAASRSGKAIHWVLAGWADASQEELFKKGIADRCSTVKVHFVDGRPSENRFSIWSVGDIFFSLSDNIQETFGLTPVEAMAAGLPSVISDWDGYKDLVRHGVDGFRIASYTPASGAGRDLALSHSLEWTNYDHYIASVSQFTAIDVPDAANALAELAASPELRARMGAAARERARSTFDWKVVIPQYEALWAELNARRRAAPIELPRSRNAAGDPWRPDPFKMFAGYPTEWLSSTTMLACAEGVTWESAKVLMTSPLVRLIDSLLPTPPEVQQILAIVAARRQCTVAEVLAQMPESRRPFLERGLLWMAKYDLLKILPRSNIIPA